MITIHRSRVETPEFFASRECNDLRERAASHFRGEYLEKSRFEFDLRRLRRHVDGPLEELFRGKCAYCEQHTEAHGPSYPRGPGTPRGPGGSKRTPKGPGKASVPSKIGRGPTESRNLEHFRPKGDALSYEERGSPQHYYWLFYDWNNLYLACETCNRNKRTQFPVLDERAKLQTPWEEIDTDEQRLLIDPSVEEPSNYLQFSDDGEVMDKPLAKLSPVQRQRARATIDLLGLNRPALRRLRMRRAGEFRALLGKRWNRGWLDSVLGELDGGLEFSALVRQMAARRAVGDPELGQLLHALEERWTPIVQAEDERTRPVIYVDDGPEEALEEAAPAEPPPQEAPEARPRSASRSSAAAQDARRKALTRSGTIKRIAIENFKSIRRLDEIEPPGAPTEPVRSGDQDPPLQVGWLSFLGENGVGKSSILQAVALTLAGPAIQDDEHLGSPSRFVRRPDAADGARQNVARVSLELTSISKPVELTISTAGGFDFGRNWQDPGLFVRAYGATRLPPSKGRGGLSAGGDAEGGLRRPPLVEYGNIFDPFTPLVDVTAWLRSLMRDKQERIEAGEDPDTAGQGVSAARKTIGDLLGLAVEDDGLEADRDGTTAEDDPDRLLVRIADDGELSVDGQPLENLSSGYQTVIALAADIMAGLPQEMSDWQTASGIILLDEIGAHLHPAWKMRIVPRLRNAFAGMQFIATTHEPLCLRGHTKNEVGVVARKPAQYQNPEDDTKLVKVVDVQLETGLDDPRNMRVDQLLTSRHFGLNSAIDPELDESFRRYYGLLAINPDARTEEQQEEVSALKANLRGVGVLGYTRRDQLVYEAIDEYIAQEDALERDARAEELTDDGKKARREAVMQNVVQLWTQAKREVRDQEEGRP